MADDNRKKKLDTDGPIRSHYLSTFTSTLLL